MNYSEANLLTFGKPDPALCQEAKSLLYAAGPEALALVPKLLAGAKTLSSKRP